MQLRREGVPETTSPVTRCGKQPAWTAQRSSRDGKKLVDKVLPRLGEPGRSLGWERSREGKGRGKVATAVRQNGCAPTLAREMKVRSILSVAQGHRRNGDDDPIPRTAGAAGKRTS